MPVLSDAEFGDITVRRHANARRMTLKLAPNGLLRISVPPLTPLAAVRFFIATERRAIRHLLKERQAHRTYDHDQPIGKSHSLVIQQGEERRITTAGTVIIVQLPTKDDINDISLQRDLRAVIIKALRAEAKQYLPRRLCTLATRHGFSYDTVRLTHASSRWGSCSSRGTISLNIALMNLPFELLDYVLIHELCHTRQMNHSPQFWAEVAQIDPLYRQHRDALKQFTPHI